MNKKYIKYSKFYFFDRFNVFIWCLPVVEGLVRNIVESQTVEDNIAQDTNIFNVIKSFKFYNFNNFNFTSERAPNIC